MKAFANSNLKVLKGIFKFKSHRFLHKFFFVRISLIRNPILVLISIQQYYRM